MKALPGLLKAALLYALAFSAWLLLPGAWEDGTSQAQAALLASSLACALVSVAFVYVARRTTFRWTPGIAVALLCSATIFAITRSGLEQPLFQGLRSEAMLLLAVVAGGALGRQVERPGQVLALSVVAASADLWSVASGPSEEIVRSGNLAYFLVSFPVAGASRVQGFIGTADFIFATMYVVLADRFTARPGRMALAVLGSMALSALLAWSLGRPVPVMPVMVATVHLVERKAFRPSEEGGRMAAAGLALILALAALTHLLR